MNFLANHRYPRVAQAFIDYMATRDIDVTLKVEEGGVSLWVTNHLDLDEAQVEWQLFMNNPSDDKYKAASWQVADSRQNNFQYSYPNFLKQITSQAGVMTLSIMAVSLVIYLLMNIGFKLDIVKLLHFPAAESQYWQVWRWLTHSVMHFSIMHIAFNLLWWWQLGGQVERKIGKSKLIQLFIISGLLSGAAQYWSSGSANFGGLSGVIYALLAYIFIMMMRKPQKGLVIEKNIVVFMLIWLVLGFVQPYLAIANMAHLGGLISGILLGLLDSQGKDKTQARRTK